MPRYVRCVSPKNLDDPLKYRTLLILPMLYRRWARLRLHNLKPWIKTWACDEMFAGTGHDGAEDAWWQTALQFENAMLKGEDITGGTADVSKCFDQVLRKLLYTLLELGGFPKRILSAYSAYMSKLLIYNMVGGSLGKGHVHPCGIPQGCPLSMMFIAFLLRPWIILMRKIKAVPRILADDIFVFAQGERHENVFKDAFDITHSFMKDIGAELAPTKSTTFSTNRKPDSDCGITAGRELGKKSK